MTGGPCHSSWVAEAQSGPGCDWHSRTWWRHRALAQWYILYLKAARTHSVLWDGKWMHGPLALKLGWSHFSAHCPSQSILGQSHMSEYRTVCTTSEWMGRGQLWIGTLPGRLGAWGVGANYKPELGTRLEGVRGWGGRKTKRDRMWVCNGVIEDCDFTHFTCAHGVCNCKS